MASRWFNSWPNFIPESLEVTMTSPLSSGHVNSASQKGHQQNCQVYKHGSRIHKNQPNVGKHIIHGSYGIWVPIYWYCFLQVRGPMAGPNLFLSIHLQTSTGGHHGGISSDENPFARIFFSGSVYFCFIRMEPKYDVYIYIPVVFFPQTRKMAGLFCWGSQIVEIKHLKPYCQHPATDWFLHLESFALTSFFNQWSKCFFWGGKT